MTTDRLLSELLPPGYSWYCKPKITENGIGGRGLLVTADDGKRTYTVFVQTSKCPFTGDDAAMEWMRQVVDLKLLYEASE